MRSGFDFRRGAWAALGVLLSLIFVPPIFADRLDAWEAANALVSADKRIIAKCGAEPRVELSRWFYTYRFSGEFAEARYRGRLVGAMCDLRFNATVRRETGSWAIHDLSY